MGVARSTFYDPAPVAMATGEVLVRIKAICDEFECYGYRREGAALRHQGVVVNNKKLRRMMREHDLQPKQRRRYVVTTDSNHASPILKNLTKGLVLKRPNQLWIADLTYVAIPGGFVYLAAILDAWSRKVVGYAISRSMDARIAIAALKSAIGGRQPPKGCIHHSERGSQGRFKWSSQHEVCCPIGSTGQAPLRVFSTQVSFGAGHLGSPPRRQSRRRCAS
jgi:putative transposase